MSLPKYEPTPPIATDGPLCYIAKFRWPNGVEKDKPLAALTDSDAIQKATGEFHRDSTIIAWAVLADWGSGELEEVQSGGDWGVRVISGGRGIDPALCIPGEFVLSCSEPV